MKNKLKKIKNINPKNRPPKLDPNARVTNETVAEHREQILKGARKYIYPLQHSKNKLVMLSIIVAVLALASFGSYLVFQLYKVKADSQFLYRVTKVLPFPVARIGSDFVYYEDYLFEINHYVYYYANQQELDFESDAGKAQLSEFKKRALQKVIDDVYIQRMARENGISVSDSEVDDAIEVMRQQSRLGGSNDELEAVLKDSWDWDINDFRRVLKAQFLKQKVLSKLDSKTHDEANTALARIRNGEDFAKVAKETSDDDRSKENGGDYGFLIEKTNRDISPKVVDALFGLKPGEVSGVVDVGYGLEIVKNIEQKDNKIKASHIVFNFEDINIFLNDQKAKYPTRSYLNL